MKRNSMMQLWLSLVLLTVILVVSVLFYIDNLNENFEREVFRTLEEVSSQEAMAIETEIQRKQDMLSDLSHVMEIDIDAEPDAILKSVHTQLQPIVEENGLRGMGVALEDGRAYSTRGEIMDIKDQEFYQRAWNGESVLSGRITLNRVAKDYVNVYATPIHDEKTGEVIGVLRYVKEQDPSILTKTGFMVGLGETDAQISALMDDVLAVGCDILTIGQYLQPSEAHWKLARYAAPEDFARYKQLALAKGFRHVASAPLARSSYRAWEALEDTHDLY